MGNLRGYSIKRTTSIDLQKYVKLQLKNCKDFPSIKSPWYVEEQSEVYGPVHRFCGKTVNGLLAKEGL